MPTSNLSLSIALQPGETHIGGIILPNGAITHTILLPGDIQANWQTAMDWAKDQGGDLPNRIELAMLWANYRDEFRRNWYWSNETHHSESAWAWSQYFHYGDQYYDRKGSQLRARAVRRLVIE